MTNNRYSSQAKKETCTMILFSYLVISDAFSSYTYDNHWSVCNTSNKVNNNLEHGALTNVQLSRNWKPFFLSPVILFYLFPNYEIQLRILFTNLLLSLYLGFKWQFKNIDCSIWIYGMKISYNFELFLIYNVWYTTFHI